MGGTGSSRANKFHYAPLLHPPVWDLKPPLWALVHKTTYEPMIYTALCIMFLMPAYPLLRQVGGGWALELSSFLGPKWHSHSVQCHFTEPKKLSNARAQPFPTCPVLDMHASKTLCTGLYKSYTVKRVDEVVRHPHLVTQDQNTQVSNKVSDIPEENFTINIELFRQTFTIVELLR
jgi:hypothetical protein